MKNTINIGIPSKGRLRKDVLKIFKRKKLKLISERGERDLIGSIKNKKNLKILYLHAREIVERLGDGSLDIGFSGFDLFKESEFNTQKKITPEIFDTWSNILSKCNQSILWLMSIGKIAEKNFLINPRPFHMSTS